MSQLLMTYVWDLPIDATAKLLLLKLADEANDAGDGINLTQQELASKTGIPKRTVRRHLGGLQEAGLLVMEAVPRYHDPASYRLVAVALQGGQNGQSVQGGQRVATGQPPKGVVEEEVLQASDTNQTTPVSPARVAPQATQDVEAKLAAAHLKGCMEARGATVFPADWHLKATATAKRMLKTMAFPELITLIDWCLAHPFYGTKVTNMLKVADRAPEWQQAGRPQPGAPEVRRGPGLSAEDIDRIAQEGGLGG